jgi:O-antigen/teichoic acid export membrane protein
MPPLGAPAASPTPRIRDALRGLIPDSSSALMMRVSRSFSSFFFNLVLARMLGAGGTGMYALALGVTELSAVVARWGMEDTVVRYLAGGKGRTRAFYGRLITTVSALALLATALVVALAPLICVHLLRQPELVMPLRVMAFSILPWSLLSIHGGLLQSAGKIPQALFVRQVGLLLVGIPLLLMFAWAGGIAGAAAAQVAAAVIVLAVSVRLWRRTVAREFMLTDDPLAPEVWSAARRTAASLGMMHLLFLSSGLADTFLLAAFASIEDLGKFRVALRVGVLGGAVLEAVTAAIAPRLAGQHARGDLRALEQTARAGALFAVALSLPYWIMVLSFPTQVLGIFGAEFAAAAPAAILLLIGRMVSTITGPVGTVLVMSGLDRPLRHLTTVVITLRILVLPLVISHWGLYGAAAVGCLSDIATNVGATVVARRKLGIVALPVPSTLVGYRSR